MNDQKKLLPANQSEELLKILKSRFKKNMHRHQGFLWEGLQTRLETKTGRENLWSLYEMERTGGQPDVVEYDSNSGAYIFYDCSPESPKGRRSVCYDYEALQSRKKHKPESNAVDMAASMGIKLLTEEQYRKLQELENVDTKTSSWLKTPPGIRDLGGAIFGDLRYGRVFTYHNGAQSYYASRGFRGWLKV